jgi:poly-beta-hydroxyalkanoate depolymerase
MTLMGGPIDTRRSPTKVKLLAQERGSAWFRSNRICAVPYIHPANSLNQISPKLGFPLHSIQNHPVLARYRRTAALAED